MESAPSTLSMNRLDQAMVQRGLCEGRERAKRLIMAGRVKINSHVARKASDQVKPYDEVVLVESERFVSRGGYKLEHALQQFQIEAGGLEAIDLGAATGGFTDCLLQAGAARVYAVDVGQGQLAWKLRSDARVVVMERTNARALTPNHFPQPVDLIVVDCSFISLRMVLPPAFVLLKQGGRIVALVKPQFEVGKAEADTGRGVIRDPALHQQVLDELSAFTDEHSGFAWRNVVESPILGPKGNKEFLVLIERVDTS